MNPNTPKAYSEEELIDMWIIESTKNNSKSVSKLFDQIKIQKITPKHQENLDKNTTETKNKLQDLSEDIKVKTKNNWKYTDKLIIKWLSEETQKTILLWITKILKNKIVTIDWKNIKFTEKYISDNKFKFIENIKQYLIVLMNIESYWWKNIENKNSSAKWPLQWIDWWKNWKKHKSFSRKNWKTTPFETALRRANKFYTWEKYPTFKSNKLPTHIEKAWNNSWKLILNEFDTEKQIQLWYIDNIMRWWRAQKLLMWIMVWNKWSAIKSYEYIHHTNSTKWTKTRQAVVNNFKHIALR